MHREVAPVFEAVVERMSATGLPGSELRERQHLDPFVKDEFERRSGIRPSSTKLTSKHFQGLGPVDVGVADPKMLIELKWSYQAPCKVFESLWDAIKLALLGLEHGYDHLYIATGASVEDWEGAACRELFYDCKVDTLALWECPLPTQGPNYGWTAGEDLVFGGWGNQPSEAPAELTMQLVAALSVAQGFELRVMQITKVSEFRPWPQIDYPQRLRG